MTTETYHKVGRGGAGNFYSEEDIEEATGRTREVSLRLISDIHTGLISVAGSRSTAR